MRIRFTNPLDALLNLQRELDGSMFSDWFGPTTTSGGAFPPINVFRREGEFVVIAELPGATKADLDIQVQNNQLRIAGKRDLATPEGASTHRAERAAERFDRSITIPSELDPDNARADYRDGILTVHLPQAARHVPRSVTIT